MLNAVGNQTTNRGMIHRGKSLLRLFLKPDCSKTVKIEFRKTEKNLSIKIFPLPTTRLIAVFEHKNQRFLLRPVWGIR
jgi:hypothetical protein